MSSRFFRYVRAGLTASLLCTGTLMAQAPRIDRDDILDRARRMEVVARQKVESEIRATLRDAQKLARTDKAKAVERLKEALVGLEGDTNLTEDRRSSLKRMLEDRIRVVQIDDTAAAENEKKEKAVNRAETGRAVMDAQTNRIKTGLKTVKDLQDRGQLGQANKEATELAKEHPEKPATQIAEKNALKADQIAAARRVKADRAQATVAATRDIEKSATPAVQDMEFPKDWREKTKNRTLVVKLTAKEKSLLQALNSPITVDFKNSKFEDVIEYLQTFVGQTILVDQESMREAEASYDSPVTAKVRNVTTRTILRKILGDLGLTYVIKDETIYVMSHQRAREMMVVRGYYVGDVLSVMSTLPSNTLGNPATFDAAVNSSVQAHAINVVQNVKTIIEMIQSSVDPSSWLLNGGRGTITFDAPSMSLIIKQSAEVHAQMGNSGILK